ncbi:Qat anti-phage system TatD family nuclease QatD [Larkinella punicea]|uniref:Hydrolase n=1 Tax=Larkinella punicea TaxID=2315727 RepID=A0A368JH73_9BACT|nr:Qat anti-phage system TatD family nuclease QatD [Larkinella punicea]RCR67018.1 hydrolase [Larkinella punicea]
MVTYIDTHCHLDLFPNIQHNPQIENNGIKSLTVTNAPYLFIPNQSLFAQCSNIKVALGFHPEVLADDRIQVQKKQQLTIFNQCSGSTRYIGEIGLDGSASLKNTWSEQISVFNHIITQCERSERKILTVHSRNAATEVINYLKSKKLEFNGTKIIMHWFSGNHHELKAAIEAGFYFSVNHRMLLSNKGKQLATLIPIDKLVTETDAPFTLDEQISSRILSLKTTVSVISQIWNKDYEYIKETIWGNFKFLLS